MMRLQNASEFLQSADREAVTDPADAPAHSIYFAQAFHHGEPEQHSFVIAVSTLATVEALAKAEHPASGVWHRDLSSTD
ncbi:hypothetical protein THIX_60599 [Thiomonas sp. X19]|uniref:hypothetical protein n=1 Tax=Thiomonas sp. X19 TaxID=1050370 RepID=UPI000B67852F|nr:hypothetical protein [Thiomonas sp. X19]SCC94541.1 hypothetical protein THIX_60599 [Thiomonas sp. X19]